MQVLCGLQVVFFLFNCQTPEMTNEEYADFGVRNCAVLKYDFAGKKD